MLNTTHYKYKLALFLRLSDGGLLLSIGGSSYTTYMKEEVASYRVTIGNQTCVLQKENDPTILRSPSAGKLINYLLEDGGHVFAGDVFAEIEVMKMVMELRATESGCVHYSKRPGAVLDAGGWSRNDENHYFLKFRPLSKLISVRLKHCLPIYDSNL